MVTIRGVNRSVARPDLRRCATWCARALTVAFCVSVAGMALPARAQDPNPNHPTGSLSEQVQNLTRRVDRLEAEVRALQHAGKASAAAVGQPAVPGPPQAVSAEQPAVTVNQSLGPEAELQHAWNQLKHGMTAAEVKTILGPPSGQFKTDNLTVWYYHYTGLGSGSVTITPDGRLSDWQKPSQGLW